MTRTHVHIADLFYSCDLGIFCTPKFSAYEEEEKWWVCVVAVSSWQFEKLRKQTQEELRNTLDQLLEAEVGVSVHQWWGQWMGDSVQWSQLTGHRPSVMRAVGGCDCSVVTADWPQTLSDEGSGWVTVFSGHSWLVTDPQWWGQWVGDSVQWSQMTGHIPTVMRAVGGCDCLVVTADWSQTLSDKGSGWVWMDCFSFGFLLCVFCVVNTGKCCLQNRKGHWYIDLDISAPKFIVPENILESNPALVVMDLGNFRLKTVVAEDAPATLDEEGGISSRC